MISLTSHENEIRKYKILGTNEVFGVYVWVGWCVWVGGGGKCVHVFGVPVCVRLCVCVCMYVCVCRGVDGIVPSVPWIPN